jgi:hypothetical protein
MKVVSPARPDCATTTWDILNERLDSRSFVRSLTLLDNLVLKHRLGQSLTEYVHFMRETFDDYNETCHMIDGLWALRVYAGFTRAPAGFCPLRGSIYIFGGTWIRRTTPFH